MRIMCLHPYLSMRAVKEMSALKELGHEVVLAYEGVGCSVEQGIGNFWDQVIQIPCNSFRGEYYFRRLFPISYKRVLKSIIEHQGLDIIHTYSMPDTLAVAAIRYSGLPVVFDVRDISSGWDHLVLEYLKSPFLNKAQELFYRKIVIKFEREANKKSGGRIYSSQEMLAYMQKLCEIDITKTIILPNYQIRSNVPQKKARKVSEQNGGIHIVYTGNILFDEYNRIIETIKDIVGHRVHLHIYPVGNSKIIGMIKMVFANEPFIHFHHPLPPKELLEEIQQYDFGLILRPPDWNAINFNLALTNKLFDYLAAGLPIATRNIEATANLVRKNGVGFVYNDTRELVEKLKRGNSNYKIDIQKFIMENHIHRVVSLYESLIANGK